MGVLHVEHGADPPPIDVELVDPLELGYLDVDETVDPEERALLRVSWRHGDLTLTGPPDLVAAHLHEVGLRALRASNDFARGYLRLGVVPE